MDVNYYSTVVIQENIYWSS